MANGTDRPAAEPATLTVEIAEEIDLESFLESGAELTGSGLNPRSEAAVTVAPGIVADAEPGGSAPLSEESLSTAPDDTAAPSQGPSAPGEDVEPADADALGEFRTTVRAEADGSFATTVPAAYGGGEDEDYLGSHRIEISADGHVPVAVAFVVSPTADRSGTDSPTESPAPSESPRPSAPEEDAVTTEPAPEPSTPATPEPRPSAPETPAPDSAPPVDPFAVSNGFTVSGGIGNAWRAHGGENGRLGRPTGEERPLPGSAYQHFEGGSIHWSPATGAHPTWGAVRSEWGSHDWERGTLGYPTSAERCGLTGGGCYQWFQGGQIHWSPASGAHATWGGMRTAWGKAGYERGSWGYPTGAEQLRHDGRWQQRFQGGTKIVGSTPSTGLPHGVTPKTGTSQLVIAHATKRATSYGTVERWELRSDRSWHKVGASWNARFGYSGLDPRAWTNHEGTGTTPMGNFSLDYAFGRDAKPAGTGLRYERMTRSNYNHWCSDVRSADYNKHLRSPSASCPSPRPGSLYETPQFNLAIAIDFNKKRIRGKGSGVLMHTNGAGSTAGCVSVTSAQMGTTTSWLDEDRSPHIVIAPTGELRYQR
ncbi:L,D-transpeptidase family protein [Brevibacterium ihuae]|uniref:L,D-transpeptidase family protein n=1 Tax=Brevibacterium ihuae TaxID=1631743 RepID=UPI000C76F75F|nr:L,D-transpeptidase family protein [Brevibacterium ihuae]